MRSRRCVLVAAIFVLVALSLLMMGCGGSSSKAKLRLINATPDIAGFDLLVDGTSVATSVGYGSASAYVSVSPGSRHLQVEPSGTTNVEIDTTQSIGSGSNLSLITLNYSGSISAALLTDDNSAPSSGNFKLRIVNASPGLGPQDVYVETYGSNISSIAPTFSSLAVGSASSYSSLGAGDYEVSFTSPGQKFVNVSSGKISFSNGQVRTMLGLNVLGGGFETTLLSDAN